jgi:hypothetical protein
VGEDKTKSKAEAKEREKNQNSVGAKEEKKGEIRPEINIK